MLAVVSLKKIGKKIGLDLVYMILTGFLIKDKLTKKKDISALLSFFRYNNNGKEKNIILVAEVRDIEYLIKIAALSKVLAEKHNFTVMKYDIHINYIDNWNVGRKDLLARNIVSRFRNNSLKQLYKKFSDGQLHSNSVPYHNQSFIREQKESILSLINLQDLNSINSIKIQDVVVGDLIYDTYLRSFHQPTIIEINDRLKLVIEWALNIYYSFKDLLDHNPIKYLINTYTAYLHFGIATRLSLKKGVKVYTVGSSSYRAQLLNFEFPFHTVNHTLFDPEKRLSEEQTNKVKDVFDSRFSGKIDPATVYMKKSAFLVKPIPAGLYKSFQLRKRNVIIYTHDFYDSPHVNRRLAFPDLYQFLKHTLEAITDIQDTTVFIKIHPNGIFGCKEQTIDLVESFKKENFVILDEEVSNLHIIDLKPDLIATARGTVCVEMAYMGIPTVALYDNIFSNFNFTHTCYDIQDYFEIIKGHKEPEIDFDKKKILSFYYQAYMEKLSPDEYKLFPYLSSSGLETYSDEYIDYILKRKEDIFSDKLTNEYLTSI